MEKIQGRYELKIHFDNNGRAFKKAIELGDTFENSKDFIAKMISDLGASGAILDQFITDPEEKDNAKLQPEVS